jgi:hypothetical protein
MTLHQFSERRGACLHPWLVPALDAWQREEFSAGSKSSGRIP